MSTQDIRPVKNRLRAECKQKRTALSDSEKVQMDARLTDRFFASRQYRENDMLFCYVSTEIEVDTREILRRAIADGKTVAVPRCVDGTREMDFYILQDMSALESGSFGVLEPNPALCRKVTDFSEGLCIIPALAFDKSGYRLGYGKGYYDRFLAKFSGETLGLVYDCCFYDSLPHGKFDRAAQWILTESEMYKAI
ncbi:MAG: 5-formyltetrahydrofolate cyclo-ligase [Lachnospiraceae bacterium]